MTRLLILILIAPALAGCVHNAHRTAEAQSFYQAQAAAAERPPILELVARPGETITLAGVERFVVHDPTPVPIREMSRAEHPAWRVADRVLAIGGIFLGQRESRRMVTELAGALTARPSIQVGRDWVEGGQHIGDAVGGDLVSGQVGDSAGRDLVGRDLISGHVGDAVGGDQVAGDRIDTSAGRDLIGGDRIDNRSGRIGSPGPFEDNSDNSDNSDSSVRPPAP